MDIAQLEDLFLKPLDAMPQFAVVDSAGREGEVSEPLRYPAASGLFLSMHDSGNKSREITELKFLLFISTKDLRGEKDAARDAYSLVVAAKAAIHGQSFETADLEPFAFVSCELSGYVDGVITYQLTFETTYYGEITIDQPV